MDKNIYSHFRPDEHPFVDKVLDWIDRCLEYKEVRRTDFLDPRQAFILNALVKRHDELTLRMDGGYPGAERVRAIIAPDYWPVEEEDMGISVLAITSHDKNIGKLEHGDYLGALIGLGMKREKIGDLHVSEKGCHGLLASEMNEFVRLHLHQVHRIQVETDILPLEALQITPPNLAETFITVASPRLDGIISESFRLSRAKALVPIKAGKCRVNWKTEEDPSAWVHEGDTISLKGFGRIRILQMEGPTKKGRIRVKIGKFM